MVRGTNRRGGGRLDGRGLRNESDQSALQVAENVLEEEEEDLLMDEDLCKISAEERKRKTTDDRKDTAKSKKSSKETNPSSAVEECSDESDSESVDMSKAQGIKTSDTP